VFRNLEAWCCGETEVARQIQNVGTVVRTAADYAAGMRTVVTAEERRLEVTRHPQAGFI
jgi:hypothetical protein